MTANTQKLRMYSEHIELLLESVRRARKYNAAIITRFAAKPRAKKVQPLPPIAGIAAAMNITVQIMIDMMSLCQKSVLT